MIIQNSNIRRNLFHNRYVILGGIFAIILVLYLIQVLNRNLQEETRQQVELKDITSNVINTNIQDIPERETVISGSNISKENQTTYSSVIGEFIEACNTHQTQKAYNLLTKECQEVLYNSKIGQFEKNYINRVFNTKKTYSIQSWANKKNPTYQVKIMQDMLTTGVIENQPIEDYYTIVKQEEGYRLNINSYIGREEINKEKQENGIKILVKYKDIYCEYETYRVEIQNLTQNTILMDSKEKTDSVYIYGNNEVKYTANLFEIDDSKLTIQPNSSKVMNLTFNKRYTTEVLISHVIWEDIILNQEEYKQIMDKQQYTNRITMTIAI